MITLAIIGVVAALTIPTVVNNYQKQQTVVQLKKAYVEINQALQMAQAEYGSPSGWGVGNFSDPLERNIYFANNYLFPYLKINKSCIPTNDECWTPPVSLTNKSGYLPNLSSSSLSTITASGYSIYYWTAAGGVNIQIWVDIDGPQKGKNMLGKDVFGLKFWFQDYFSPNGESIKQGTFLGASTGANLEPLFLSRDEIKNYNQHGCNKDTDNKHAGRFCADLIMYDGWQIKDDYPW